jgi:hypothetical protein
MSASGYSDHPEPAPAGDSVRAKAAKAAAAIVVVAALVFGANAITKSNASSSSSSASPGATAAQSSPSAAAGPTGGGAPPQMGTPVTGATLTKVTAAATAKYPGTVERAMKLSDGSYVVHVIRSSGAGEVHVLVSRDFTVTGVGVEQGGPRGMPPAGSTAPNGTAPSGTAPSGTAPSGTAPNGSTGTTSSA